MCKAHQRARRRCRQPVVDEERAEIVVRAGVRDLNPIAAKPAAAPLPTDVGVGMLGQFEICFIVRLWLSFWPVPWEIVRRGVQRRHIARRQVAVFGFGDALAGLPDFDIADMAGLRRIAEKAIVVGEIRLRWRHVLRTRQAQQVALQAMNIGLRGVGHVDAVSAGPQAMAGRPEHGVTSVEIKRTGLVMAVAQSDPAFGMKMARRYPDRIAFGIILDPHAFGCGVVRILPAISQRLRLCGFGKHRVVVAAARRAALGQDKPSLTVEQHVRHGFRMFGTADGKLPSRVIQEVAVLGKTDRPDFRTFSNRIIEPATMHGHAPDHTGLRGVAPCAGIFDVKSRVLDVCDSTVVGHRRQAARGASVEAVIEAADHRTVSIDTIDQTIVQIRREELLIRGIVNDIAHAWTGIAGQGGE